MRAGPTGQHTGDRLTALTQCHSPRMVARLELVHGADLHGLHVVLQGLNAVGDVVHEHLVVVDDAGHDELLDAEGHGLELVALPPHEALLLVLLDLVPHHDQIGVGLPGLHLECNERAEGFGCLRGLLGIVGGLRGGALWKGGREG